MRKRIGIAALVGGAVLIAGSAVAFAGPGLDFGVFRDQALSAHSNQLFGVNQPLDASSTRSINQAEALADPTSLATLAKGLQARVVTTQGPAVDDQISLWPNDENPTYLIACNEEGTAQPGLVRIELATGTVSTIVTGTTSCDPTRRTPWGTILFGEEAGTGGQLYELIDPIHTTGVTLNRVAGTFSGGTGAANLIRRDALGRAAFEGIGILANGTTYLDPDDTSIGPKNGGPGAPYFKFIPDHPFTGTSPITNLAQSPYASGQVYAMRVGPGTSYGQGREFGFAQWIPLPHQANPDLENLALAAGVTGYYRPEDMALDPVALQQGNVRFCSADTGDETQHLYGQIICVTDGTIAQAEANQGKTEAQPFVFGGTSQGINMPDNVAFQPHTNNLVVHEDAETTFESPHNNDLWSCLPDGADQDLLSDGCARIATLNDLTAEWTGGIFDASGSHFYVSIQHNISGKATILDITGWKYGGQS
jgi:hypothetical protein